MSDFWKGLGCAVTFGAMAGCATNEALDPTDPVAFEIPAEEDLGLMGPDADENGVRDYIDSYITEVIADDPDPIRAAEIEATYTLYAKELQFQILNSENPSALYASVDRIAPSIGCQVRISSDSESQNARASNSQKARSDIRYLSSNTPERYDALRQVNRNLSGGVLQLASREEERLLCPSF